jgi:hypothetical protein
MHDRKTESANGITDREEARRIRRRERTTTTGSLDLDDLHLLLLKSVIDQPRGTTYWRKLETREGKRGLVLLKHALSKLHNV